ncbi:MAG: PKD domain-containing protein [Candidatus Micrarchaeales archaeon]
MAEGDITDINPDSTGLDSENKITAEEEQAPAAVSQQGEYPEDKPTFVVQKPNYTLPILVIAAVIIGIIVLLHFFNPFQGKGTQTANLGAQNAPPVIIFNSSRASALNVSLSYIVRPKASGASINATKSTINWGDGDITTLMMTKHTYSKYQNYTIVITAYDTYGNKNTTTTSLQLHQQASHDTTPPYININVNVTGLTAKVRGIANPYPSQEVSGAKITQLLINWDDGNLTNGFTQYTHTYSGSGSYDIVVTAIDSFGNRNTANKTIYVSGPAGTVQYSGLCPSIPPTIIMNQPKIDGYSVDASGSVGPSIIGGTINWGDGNTTLLSEYTHTYAGPGQYRVSITVYDQCNTKANYQATVNIALNSSRPVVLLNPPNVTEYKVDISGNVISEARGSNIDWSRTTINWGDGTVTPFSIYTHNYTQPSIYTIAVTTVDTLGNKNVSFITVRVPNLPNDFQITPNPLNVIHIGQNVSSGIFNVFLTNITAPDQNGNSDAVLAIYSKNSLVEQAKIAPLSTLALNISDKTLWIYIGHTFTGVAAQNWTEIELLTN